MTGISDVNMGGSMAEAGNTLETGNLPQETGNIDELSRQFRESLVQDNKDKSSSDSKNVGKEQHETTQESKKTEGKKPSRSEAKTPGDVQLMGMQSGQVQQTDNSALRTVEAPVSDTSAQLTADLTELVNQIAVNCDNVTGKREVFMTLESSQFPDTNLKIGRLNGELQLEFSTASATSRENLAAAQNNLQTRLADRLGEGVTINVVSTETQSDAGTNDGRSRQQRFIFEEVEKG